jgi:GMP synthase (glutamine-hydrolysing)
MKECFKSVKKILAICWGMQVAVTAAGGEVKRGITGSHIGIANDIELTNDGLNNLLYKDKKNKFNSPAFNFDEVSTTPSGAIHLASNRVNKIQSLNFKMGVSEIWGLQYHPEISYNKMVDIIKFRKDLLIEKRNRFKDEDEINNHINFIEEEIKISEKGSRMLEIRNWLNLIN